MTRVTKYASESVFRYHEFRRSDGRGWLNAEETLTGTPAVTVTSRPLGTDCTAGMVSEVAVYNDTAVRYRLAGGVSGEAYIVAIAVETSNGQVFEDRLELAVA
jgi:hypothetical protein